MSLNKLPLYLLLAIIAIGGALRIDYFNPGIRRTPDERTYTRQADIVLAQGADGYRFLGQELAANPPAVSRYPSPLRVGYITLLTLFMRLTGDTSILTGAHLSFLCSMASLCLIAFTAYRYLSPTVAVVATLFFAVLPFDLTVFRRTWEEAFIALLTIGILALALRIVHSSARYRIAWLSAFSFLGFLALTTKENSGLTFLFCAAGLTLYFLLQRDRRAAMLTASSAAVAVLAYVIVLGSLFGGVANALTLVREYAHYSGINPYSVQYDSGPVWLFPEGLFRISPFLCLAGLAGLASAIYSALRSRAVTGLPLSIAALTAGILLLQLVTHRYSFRYTAPVYTTICLLAGIGVDAVLPSLHRVLAPLGRITAWAVLGFAISIAAYRDLNFAQENLILPELQDLALRPILGLPPAPVPPDYPK
jgi:Dolichyl-phosphate-mannose-protein mannosyltransferase